MKEIAMNVVLILAKEGSIGLPGKNIWKIKDRTLLSWLIGDAKKAKLVEKIYVSTNGKKTAQIAKECGAEIIMRKDELAHNDKFLDAVDHAVKAIKKENPDLEIITLPQCVIPFKDPDIIDRCISFLKENEEYDSVVTIQRAQFIPEALMKIVDVDCCPCFLKSF